MFKGNWNFGGCHCDVLLVYGEEGLLGGTFFALDGCKLAPNTSKEWSGTIGDLRKKKERIEKKAKQNWLKNR